MKITYAVMPTGDPVRFIDGASAARRAVKTTLKNLKRWCAQLRRGTAARVNGFKGERPDRPDVVQVSGDDVTAKTMVVDPEESRNRANENLENELKESLASNDRSGAHGDESNCGCQSGDQRADGR